MVIGQDLVLNPAPPFSSLAPGRYRFGIRPNHLYLRRQTEGDVKIDSTVEISEINGSETFIHFMFDNVRTVLHEVGIEARKIDSKITAFVNPEKFFVYSEDGSLLISPDRPAL